MFASPFTPQHKSLPECRSTSSRAVGRKRNDFGSQLVISRAGAAVLNHAAMIVMDARRHI